MDTVRVSVTADNPCSEPSPPALLAPQRSLARALPAFLRFPSLPLQPNNEHLIQISSDYTLLRESTDSVTCSSSPSALHSLMLENQKLNGLLL